MQKKFILLTLIILLGASLRLYNVSDKELWYDEAFSAEMVTNSYSEIFRLSKADVHPPLYYFVLKLFTSIFGNSELALRSPSILFGVGLIILVYYLVAYIAPNKNKAILASLVIAVNPFLVTYSREARSYSMLAFLTVLAFFFLIKALRDRKYIAISILLPILFLTHYIAVFVLVVFATILLLNNKKAIIYMLPLIMVVALWIPIMIGGSDNVGLNWLPRFSLNRVPQSVHAFILGVDNNNPHLPPPLNPFPIESKIITLLIFGCVSFLILVSKPSKEEGLLLVCSLVPMVLVALASRYLDSHFFVERFLIGYGALLIVYCAIKLPKFHLFITLPYIAAALFLIFSYKVVNVGYRELAKYPLDKPVVMVDASEFINFKYYSDKIKLQEGDWSEWGIIKNEHILNKQEANADFYLVTRGPLAKWEPRIIVGEFYFYDWSVSQ